jgi:hypothetical protein
VSVNHPVAVLLFRYLVIENQKVCTQQQLASFNQMTLSFLVDNICSAAKTHHKLGSLFQYISTIAVNWNDSFEYRFTQWHALLGL